MRLNQFIARATGMSRRAADDVIRAQRVQVNGLAAQLGQTVETQEQVTLDGQLLTPTDGTTTILFNKPVGYVCSRDGQGNKTIYELLPAKLHDLKPIGRLDKNSSGLLLLTNDGQLAYELSHPKFKKTKIYKIALSRPLKALQQQMVVQRGVMLEDGRSKLKLERINNTDDTNWKVIMSEGRNRQIRRTFEALGYSVVKLHRTQFGSYQLGSLEQGSYKTV